MSECSTPVPVEPEMQMIAPLKICMLHNPTSNR